MFRQDDRETKGYEIGNQKWLLGREKGRISHKRATDLESSSLVGYIYRVPSTDRKGFKLSGSRMIESQVVDESRSSQYVRRSRSVVSQYSKNF